MVPRQRGAINPGQVGFRGVNCEWMGGDPLPVEGIQSLQFLRRVDIGEFEGAGEQANFAGQQFAIRMRGADIEVHSIFGGEQVGAEHFHDGDAAEVVPAVRAGSRLQFSIFQHAQMLLWIASDG